MGKQFKRTSRLEELLAGAEITPSAKLDELARKAIKFQRSYKPDLEIWAARLAKETVTHNDCFGTNKSDRPKGELNG